MILSTPIPNTSRPIFVKGDIKYGDITSFTATQNGIPFKVYTDQDIVLMPGDRVQLEGDFQEQNASTIPHTFNYRNYLLSKRIRYTLFSDSIEITGHRFSFQEIRHFIGGYIENNAPLSSHYIKTFILADQSGFDDDIKEDINILGVSHLFAVSGLHIGLLTMAIDCLMKKYIPRIPSQKVIIPMLILYMILTSFSPSVIRAGCLYIGIYLNKKYDLEFSLLDILSTIFILYLIISPYAIYSLGFSLSFLVTFSIILGQYLLKDKSKISQLLIISIIALLISLPITVSVNKRINLLTIAVNVFLIYGMSFIILPVGYITFLLPFLDPLYFFFIQMYEKIITLFSKVIALQISFSFVNHFQILLYYIILTLILMNYGRRTMKRYIYLGVLFIIISMNIQTLNPVQSVSMIDVYGDSIFIKDSFDRCNILVDTGISDEYDSIVQYLKGRNIKRIDYLIVSHEDSDHNGERENIYENFKVIYEINKSNMPDGEMKCGGITLQFYPFQKIYREENNQSGVFTLTISDTTYLFTGDIEYQKELEFVKLYDIDVDILKSPHHGSISSSTEKFLDDIRAEEVWISCYRRNTHNHPHPEIIDRYETRNMEIFRTDNHGTIEQYFIFGKAYKRLHIP